MKFLHLKIYKRDQLFQFRLIIHTLEHKIIMIIVIIMLIIVILKVIVTDVELQEVEFRSV